MTDIEQLANDAHVPGSSGEPHSQQDSGIGCISALIIINTVVMGLVAWTFVGGPFSSREQEFWYRYGSLGFLLIGAILPAATLRLGAKRSPTAMLVLMAWMFAVLFAFCGYVMLSGGGV